ncbi:MAG: hypothetical protein WC817_04340 [Patescibacteria group bacterium]|jgi:hypothetical protein
MPITRIRKLFAVIKNILSDLVTSIREQPLRRLLPFIGAALIVLFLELLVTVPINWPWILLITSILVVANSIALSNRTLLVAGWWHTLFTPVLLTFSAGVLLLFATTALGRQAVILLVAACLFLFWEHIWRYYWNRETYHDESLENASLTLNTIIVWFTSLFLYYLLLDPSVLPEAYVPSAIPASALWVVLVVFYIDYRTLWVQRYAPSRVWLLLVTQSIVIGELFWVLNFLPNFVEVKAFFVVLAYYLFTNLGRSYLDGTLRPAVLRRYAYITLASLLAVLATTRWLL